MTCCVGGGITAVCFIYACLDLDVRERATDTEKEEVICWITVLIFGEIVFDPRTNVRSAYSVSHQCCNVDRS